MLKITAKIKARPFPKDEKQSQSMRFNDIKTVEIEGTDFEDVKSQLAELVNTLSQDIPVLQFAYDLDFRYGQLTPLVDAYYQMVNKKAQEEIEKLNKQENNNDTVTEKLNIHEEKDHEGVNNDS